MPKSTDVPHELRALNKVFSTNDYKWDYADSFRDWVDFLVEAFMPVRQTDRRPSECERLKQKHGSLDWFTDMTREWLLVQQQMIVGDGPGDWYDALGTFYEVIAPNSKKGVLGQFFTPPEVCDMMTIMTGFTPDLKGKGFSIQDPCSGSGRMLLAAHTSAPGNYQYAADLDRICAKMSAVNMCIHGCVGQAVCMNSLTPDDWFFGYNINPRLNRTGCPSIEPITKEQCRAWRLWQAEKAAWEEKKRVDPKAPAPVPPAAKSVQMGQLSLF
ncbi:type I restriction enzyme, M subunit [Fibrella aestuarina BUZ 2]|uniref:Type I restriction enzyme, M subunit n=1 Tax=Fibrella aestuarina BUZ 2 TaxID=1166018 RepID=I0K851_9BACT|nr:N-6 DNA methylase [Fibrella aestuarina]CCH00304.1 type I restriction enzyme, M subunit [Fibrella aestuarina BUZ 2]